jgi:hypothetical protein
MIRLVGLEWERLLAVPPGTREVTERALPLHPQGCPAYQSVKGAIEVTWEAMMRVGERNVHLAGGDPDPE